MPIELTLDGWLKIAAIIVTLLLAYFGRQRRPRVEAFLIHAASHPIPAPANQANANTNPAPVAAPPQAIHTHTLIVRNSGREPAKNVRIAHGTLPESVNVWPPRSYQKVSLPNLALGGELVFDALSPGEQLTIAYLYVPPLTYEGVGTTVKSDEGVVQILPITIYTRVYALWVRRVVGFFVLVGVATTIFFALKYVLLPYLAK